jgi:hypothetical protein
VITFILGTVVGFVIGVFVGGLMAVSRSCDDDEPANPS